MTDRPHTILAQLAADITAMAVGDLGATLTKTESDDDPEVTAGVFLHFEIEGRIYYANLYTTEGVSDGV